MNYHGYDCIRTSLKVIGIALLASAAAMAILVLAFWLSELS